MNKQSIREKMLQEVSLGLNDDTLDNVDGSNDAAAALRKEIADLEAVNQKMKRQCDRMKASNARMESGSKTRTSATREVAARLEKLQQIQNKLNRVYQEFQNEHDVVQKELDETNIGLAEELTLQKRSKACIGQIVDLMKSESTDSGLIKEIQDLANVY